MVEFVQIFGAEFFNSSGIDDKQYTMCWVINSLVGNKCRIHSCYWDCRIEPKQSNWKCVIQCVKSWIFFIYSISTPPPPHTRVNIHVHCLLNYSSMVANLCKHANVLSHKIHRTTPSVYTLHAWILTSYYSGMCPSSKLLHSRISSPSFSSKPRVSQRRTLRYLPELAWTKYGTYCKTKVSTAVVIGALTIRDKRNTFTCTYTW